MQEEHFRAHQYWNPQNSHHDRPVRLPLCGLIARYPLPGLKQQFAFKLHFNSSPHPCQLLFLFMSFINRVLNLQMLFYRRNQCDIIQLYLVVFPSWRRLVFSTSEHMQFPAERSRPWQTIISPTGFPPRSWKFRR